MALVPRVNYRKKLQKSKRPVLIEFVSSLGSYLAIRSRQLVVLTAAGFSIIIAIISSLKEWAVQRMFWGRSSLYRSVFHIIVAVITVSVVLSGLANRLNLVSNQGQGLDLSTGIIGRQDKFSQLGTSESITAVGDYIPDYDVYKHVIEKEDTLSKISELYNVKQDTIKWANSLTSDTLKVGTVLRIPAINGVFIKVEKGDTLESIAKENKGTVADILDLNSHTLDSKNPELKEGMELFIPGGEPPPPPKPVVAKSTSSGASYTSSSGGGVSVPSGTLINPLKNCPGYSYSRGFSYYHGGVDLAKRGGCWISAAGSGTVTYAGWSSAGQGYNVAIDHGGGLSTKYYHGNGKFAVRSGQTVQAGQNILYMGCTGYCTGTHLHFEVRVGGGKRNPESYVKVR